MSPHLYLCLYTNLETNLFKEMNTETQHLDNFNM